MALENAATGTSILAEWAPVAASAQETGRRLFAAIALRLQNVLDPYRPGTLYAQAARWRLKHGVTVRHG